LAHVGGGLVLGVGQVSAELLDGYQAGARVGIVEDSQGERPDVVREWWGDGRNGDSWAALVGHVVKYT
jgi:hypothetical protein